MKLLLLQFNNYRNRKIKRYSTVEDYISRSSKNAWLEEGQDYVNFKTFDDITTEQIVNWHEEWNPDYLLTVNDYNEIVSRWFIIKHFRLSGDQYRLALKRDSVSECLPKVLTAPSFIYKGHVNDNSPLVFNKELDFTCNQIKKGEVLLYDRSRCNWLVMYYDHGSAQAATKLKGSVTLAQMPIDIVVQGPLSSWSYYQTYRNGFNYTNNESANMYVQANMPIIVTGSGGSASQQTKNYNIFNMEISFDTNLSTNQAYCSRIKPVALVDKIVDEDNNALYSELEYYPTQSTYPVTIDIAYVDPDTFSFDTEYFTRTYAPLAGSMMAAALNFNNYASAQLRAIFDRETAYQNMWANNGKIIKTTETGGVDKYWRVRVRYLNPIDVDEDISGSVLTNTLQSRIVNSFGYSNAVYNQAYFGDSNGNFSFDQFTFRAKCSGAKYEIIFEDVTAEQAFFDFDFTAAPALRDQPYGIIAMPFSMPDDNPIELMDIDTYGSVQCSVYDGLTSAIARTIASDGVGSDKFVYDIQILPYCPFDIPNYRISAAIGGRGLDPRDVPSEQWGWVYKTGTSTHAWDLALFPTESKFTRNISVLNNTDDQEAINILRGYGANVKLSNQCDFVRLVSPNYNGQYEIIPARNDGVRYVNIDCAYKPWQPYIHANPIFASIMGQDFDDARGLICGGDFSFSVTSSAFETYKMQNKNYQEIFDRQISNMSTNYVIDQKYRGINALMGAAGGLATAVGGIVAQNPAAIAGGAMTMGVSIGKGITSSFQAKEKYSEARDFAIDNFNYQLDNIKALPDSLTKVDAYNNNNKKFPFIEIYSCTDEEKEIFLNKLEYDGMTVNALGKINDYIDYQEEKSFIRADIRILDDIGYDADFAEDIAREVSRGVYIYGDYN